MATFRIHLTGTAKPLLVDLSASNIEELGQDVTCSRFLVGHMVEPDEDGVCPGVMIQTNRIQAVFEA